MDPQVQIWLSEIGFVVLSILLLYVGYLASKGKFKPSGPKTRKLGLVMIIIGIIMVISYLIALLINFEQGSTGYFVGIGMIGLFILVIGISAYFSVTASLFPVPFAYPSKK